MVNVYDVGDSVVLIAEFTDPRTGDPIDPGGTISVTLRDPLGVETTYTYLVDPEVVKESVGIYLATILIDSAGAWYYRWISCGLAQGENIFTVKTPVVSPVCS
jgi:hypothetical protein